MYKSIAKGVLTISVLATLSSTLITVPASANDTGIATMLHSVRAERGKVCMVGHYHIGDSPRAYKSRSKAHRAAIRHWVTFTAAEYGTDWGNYNRAANRSADCEKASSSTWICKIKARPCRRGRSVAAK
ncbi:MAG: hypothetical protein L3J67_01000 [Hyphomicrobiaceae bacterium]|nr:hypothetical protein [Hyphomicrobiaceae bacterium]